MGGWGKGCGAGEDGVEEYGCEGLFGLLWEGVYFTVREAEGDGVFRAVKSDAWLGDIIGDDEVAFFAGEFGLGEGDEVFGFGGKADEVAAELELGAGAAENVFGGFEMEGEGGGVFFEFLGGGGDGAVVGDGGGEDGDVAVGDGGANGVEHLAGGLDLYKMGTGGGREGDWARDEGDVMVAVEGGLGEGVAHFA